MKEKIIENGIEYVKSGDYYILECYTLSTVDKDIHYAKTMRRFCDSENELGKMLKGKPLHIVNDLINASDEIVAITSIENFKLGFRLGVQMICDSLICDDSIFKDL